MELIASIVIGSHSGVVLDALVGVRCFFRERDAVGVLGGLGE